MSTVLPQLSPDTRPVCDSAPKSTRETIRTEMSQVPFRPSGSYASLAKMARGPRLRYSEAQPWIRVVSHGSGLSAMDPGCQLGSLPERSRTGEPPPAKRRKRAGTTTMFSVVDVNSPPRTTTASGA